jgi:hypothetical protein
MIDGYMRSVGARTFCSHHINVFHDTPSSRAASTRRSLSSRRRRMSFAPRLSPSIASSSGFRAVSTSGTPGSRKATRACRCGVGGPGKGACGKAPRCQRDYQNRISGPLLDRIDLQVDVPPVTAADLALPAPSEGTAEAAARVGQARQAQEERGGLNAVLEGKELETAVALDDPARALMSRAAEAGQLTARGWTRTLRLARTIADLEGALNVRRVHVAEALIYRRVGPATPEPMGAMQSFSSTI